VDQVKILDIKQDLTLNLAEKVDFKEYKDVFKGI
jgi:hypothetical protein